MGALSRQACNFFRLFLVLQYACHPCYNRVMAKQSILSEKIIERLQTHHLQSVKQLIEYFKAIGTPYNKTSIYRSIEKLIADTIICKHDFSTSESSYELHDHHHDHIVCTSCGIIEKIDCQLPTISPTTSYRIHHHHLTLYGTCPQCTQEQKTTRSVQS